MGNLFRMELFKMRKHKLTWGAGIACFVVTIIIPIIGKILSNVLYDIVKNSGEADAIKEAKVLVEEFNRPVDISSLIRMPFGGLSIVLILVFLAAASYLFLDIGGGYIKNIAGQIPSRGHSCYGKYAAVCLQGLIFMVCGFAGSVIGTLASRGVTFGEGDMGGALLEFALKWLILCGLNAVLLFFTSGLCNKALGIVMAVIFGTGALGVIYMPISFGVKMLFHLEQFDIGKYMPDQMLSLTPISIWAALISGAVLILVFVPITIRVMNRKDVK